MAFPVWRKQRDSIPETCAGSQRLIKRLAEVPEGETISYKELTGIAGKDVKGEGRYMLETARRALRREQNMEFGAVRGEGVKRLTDSDVAELGPASVSKVRRSAKLQCRRLSCVRDFNALSQEQRVTRNTSMTVLHAMAVAGSPKMVRAIETSVRKMQKELPFQATLAVYAGKDNENNGAK
jgi:hypothetical protein